MPQWLQGSLQGSLRGWWRAALLGCALAWALAWACPGTALADGLKAETPAIQVTEAQFQRLDTGVDGPWQRVALPDTWAARGLPQSGSARYRARFFLAAPPAEAVWAVRVDRLSTTHTMRVNGVLVNHQRGGDEGKDDVVRLATSGKTTPVLAEFPSQLLKQGDNQIDIEWRLITRAGMSDITVGPSIGLRGSFDTTQLWDRTAPQLINAAGAALAGFMLLIWWQRRSERSFGLFGLLWLLVSLRNSTYYIDTTPVPVNVAVLLYFLAQCGSAVLLGAFAVSISSTRWPRFEAALRWAGGLSLVVGLLGAALGRLPDVRAVAYLGVIGLSLVSLRVLWHTVRQAPRRALVALLLGLVVVQAAGLHDYLYLQGRLPITHFFWMPYAVPLGCVWFAMVLIQRMVQALQSSEDLTARLETRVAERTVALDHANLAQSRFLAAASHDLRQPVVAIGLLVGLLREQVQAPEQRHLLDRTHEAARALEDLLRGLLDLSRLDAGAAMPVPQPVALQPLFNAIAAHERPSALARGLDLRFRAAGRVVMSDPLLLEQILRNLVANALRYTTRGGVLVTARVGAGGVRLQVWDTGRGIALADQQRVFEPFVQLDNPERDRRKGQGLGLAIVQRSVDLLGHGLTLRSQPGRGSCFTLTLPAVAAQWAPRASDDICGQPLARQRIWLLDDDPAVREAIAARLRAWGAEVQPFIRLADLTAALASGVRRPDWLLTDHRLPDGDGAQAIAQLHATFGPVPALMVTGDTAPAEMQKLAALGVEVLHKPFRPEALLHKLQQRPAWPPPRG